MLREEIKGKEPESSRAFITFRDGQKLYLMMKGDVHKELGDMIQNKPWIDVETVDGKNFMIQTARIDFIQFEK